MEVSSSDSKNGKKRSLRAADEDLDDLVGQICSRLNDLKTVDRQQHLDAFIEVLECSMQEATFFLESSDWDISTAVSLFLENQPNTKRRAIGNEGIPERGCFMPIEPRKSRFIPKQIVIDHLTDGWEASVSPHSGQIVFFHPATLTRQYCVPPGFSDKPDPSETMVETTDSIGSNKFTNPSPCDSMDAVGGDDIGDSETLHS